MSDGKIGKRRNEKQTDIMIDYLLEPGNDDMTSGTDENQDHWFPLVEQLNEAKNANTEDRTTDNWIKSWRHLKSESVKKCKLYMEAHKKKKPGEKIAVGKSPLPQNWRIYYAEREFFNRSNDVQSVDEEHAGQEKSGKRGLPPQSAGLTKKLKSSSLDRTRRKPLIEKLEANDSDEASGFQTNNRSTKGSKKPWKESVPGCIILFDEDDIDQDSEEEKPKRSIAETFAHVVSKKKQLSSEAARAKHSSIERQENERSYKAPKTVDRHSRYDDYLCKNKQRYKSRECVSSEASNDSFDRDFDMKYKSSYSPKKENPLGGNSKRSKKNYEHYNNYEDSDLNNKSYKVTSTRYNADKYQRSRKTVEDYEDVFDKENVRRNNISYHNDYNDPHHDKFNICSEHVARYVTSKGVSHSHFDLEPTTRRSYPPYCRSPNRHLVVESEHFTNSGSVSSQNNIQSSIIKNNNNQDMPLSEKSNTAEGELISVCSMENNNEESSSQYYMVVLPNNVQLVQEEIVYDQSHMQQYPVAVLTPNTGAIIGTMMNPNNSVTVQETVSITSVEPRDLNVFCNQKIEETENNVRNFIENIFNNTRKEIHDKIDNISITDVLIN